MPLDDDSLLAKYKLTGVSNERISQKLGITTEEVELRWKRIVEASKSSFAGLVGLTQQFQIMAHQYQLLGESLKPIAAALTNTLSPTEIRALVDKDPEKTVHNLITGCIIIRPFTPVDPAESLQNQLKSN